MYVCKCADVGLYLCKKVCIHDCAIYKSYIGIFGIHMSMFAHSSTLATEKTKANC
jgi:hypothetical protein